MMQTTPKQLLSFSDFIAQYGDSNRYKVIDGEVFNLEPTGFHEEVSAFITTKVCAQIDAISLNWFVFQHFTKWLFYLISCVLFVLYK